MIIGTICTRDVCTCSPLDPLVSAAQAMTERHIGALVVVDSAGERVRPVGIVTDRDIVRGQLDRAQDLYCLSVEDVMTSNPLTVAQTSGMAEALARLSERGVRRAPVVDEGGNLVGIVSTDDLFPALAAELGVLAQLIGMQPKLERPPVRVP
jgi:CBS domain-containing protein